MMKLLILSLGLAGFSLAGWSQTESSPMSEVMKELSAKRDIVAAWAPLCEDGSQSHGICPFGDMTIFSGMGCLSGIEARCDDVKRAQGPDGRWWRSPQLVGTDENINTFSRDQAKGALAYLVATKDVGAALRWQAYLEANDLKMCPRADDNRCKITMGISRLFGATWDYLGLKPADWMNKGKLILKIYSPVEVMVQPDDFPMHLTALNAWIRLEIERRGGVKRESYDKRLLKTLVRREPKNPFFLMLSKGPTKEVADLILDRCPNEIPTGKDSLDWSWQRSQNDKEKIWLKSSGHDCVFIINLFERELGFRK